MKTNFKLEVNKKYINRANYLVTIKSIEDGYGTDELGFIYNENGECVNRTNMFLFENIYDLIKERDYSKLELKVGHTYRDRRNSQVKIIESYISNNEICFVGFNGNETKHYDSDGGCFEEIEWTGMYNIIEKCKFYNPFLNENIRLKKMLSNYKTYGNLVIGLDFDFTIKCPINHYVYDDILEFLQSIQDKEKYNFTFCIWTANMDREMVEKTYLENGLRWDYYNYSPINPSGIKPHFNILLDDSAGLSESLRLLQNIKLELDKNKEL